MTEERVLSLRPEPTPRGEPGPARLASLDGLRGLAVLLVILFHLRNGDSVGYHPAVAGALAPFRFGYAGVHLFLVLSGFCLTHSLLRQTAAGRRLELRGYLAARFRRIAPPYYAAMLAYLAIPAAYLLIGHPSPSTRVLTLRQVGTHLLFLHGLRADTIEAINTPFWSLSLEFQFYLVLPLLFVLATRVGAGAVVVAVACASLAWRIALATLGPGHEHLLNGFLLGRLTEFALGMAVAFWYQGEGGRDAPALALGSGLVLLAAGGVLSALRHTLTTDLVIGLGFAALLVATLGPSAGRGRWRRLLEWPPLAGIGVISYSLYLTHSFFLERSIQVYRRFFPRPSLGADTALVVVAVALALAGGWCFYRLVERRFVRSIDSAARRGHSRAGLSGAASPGSPTFSPDKIVTNDPCQATTHPGHQP